MRCLLFGIRSVGSDRENLVAHRATRLKDLAARIQNLVARKKMERKSQKMIIFTDLYLFHKIIMINQMEQNYSQTLSGHSREEEKVAV